MHHGVQQKNWSVCFIVCLIGVSLLVRSGDCEIRTSDDYLGDNTAGSAGTEGEAVSATDSYPALILLDDAHVKNTEVYSATTFNENDKPHYEVEKIEVYNATTFNKNDKPLSDVANIELYNATAFNKIDKQLSDVQNIEVYNATAFNKNYKALYNVEYIEVYNATTFNKKDKPHSDVVHETNATHIEYFRPNDTQLYNATVNKTNQFHDVDCQKTTKDTDLYNGTIFSTMNDLMIDVEDIKTTKALGDVFRDNETGVYNATIKRTYTSFHDNDYTTFINAIVTNDTNVYNDTIVNAKDILVNDVEIDINRTGTFSSHGEFSGAKVTEVYNRNVDGKKTDQFLNDVVFEIKSTDAYVNFPSTTNAETPNATNNIVGLLESTYNVNTTMTKKLNQKDAAHTKHDIGNELNNKQGTKNDIELMNKSYADAKKQKNTIEPKHGAKTSKSTKNISSYHTNMFNMDHNGNVQATKAITVDEKILQRHSENKSLSKITFFDDSIKNNLHGNNLIPKYWKKETTTNHEEDANRNNGENRNGEKSDVEKHSHIDNQEYKQNEKYLLKFNVTKEKMLLRRNDTNMKNLEQPQYKHERNQFSYTIKPRSTTLSNGTDKKPFQQKQSIEMNFAESKNQNLSTNQLRTYLTHPNKTENFYARHNKSSFHLNQNKKENLIVNTTDQTLFLSNLTKTKEIHKSSEKMTKNNNEKISKIQGTINGNQGAIGITTKDDLINDSNGLSRKTDYIDVVNNNSITTPYAKDLEEEKDLDQSKQEQYKRKTNTPIQFLFGFRTSTYDSRTCIRLSKEKNVRAKIVSRQTDGRLFQDVEKNQIKTLVNKILSGRTPMFNFKLSRVNRLRFNNTIAITHPAPEEDIDDPTNNQKAEPDEAPVYKAMVKNKNAVTNVNSFYKPRGSRTQKPAPVKEVATEQNAPSAIDDILRTIKGAFKKSAEKVESLHLMDSLQEAAQSVMKVPHYVLGLAESLVRLF